MIDISPPNKREPINVIAAIFVVILSNMIKVV
jgi:hypothetical protein